MRRFDSFNHVQTITCHVFPNIDIFSLFMGCRQDPHDTGDFTATSESHNPMTTKALFPSILKLRVGLEAWEPLRKSGTYYDLPYVNATKEVTQLRPDALRHIGRPKDLCITLPVNFDAVPYMYNPLTSSRTPISIVGRGLADMLPLGGDRRPSICIHQMTDQVLEVFLLMEEEPSFCRIEYPWPSYEFVKDLMRVSDQIMQSRLSIYLNLLLNDDQAKLLAPPNIPYKASPNDHLRNPKMKCSWTIVGEARWLGTFMKGGAHEGVTKQIVETMCRKLLAVGLVKEVDYLDTHPDKGAGYLGLYGEISGRRVAVKRMLFFNEGRAEPCGCCGIDCQ